MQSRETPPSGPTGHRSWLLLHGAPLAPSIWTEVAEQLASTGSVVTPWVQPSAQRPTQTDVAQAIAADLRGNGRTYDVVGHSFGGQVALELALVAPDLVRRLTLLCTRDTPHPPFAAVAEAVAAGHLPAVDATMKRWFLPTEWRRENLPAVYRAREALERADPAGWARALAAISQYDRSAEVPGIQVPVSLLAAGHDPVSTPAAMSELAHRLPRGRLHVSPDAAHLSPFTEPEALARFLIDAAT